MKASPLFSISALSPSVFTALLFSAALDLPQARTSAAFTGDLNGDKSVDAADAKYFLDAVAGGTPPAGAWDLDADGKVGLPDALLFGRWIDGLWDKPSAGLGSLYFRNPADSAVYARYKDDVKAKTAWGKPELTAAYPANPVPFIAYPAGALQYETLVVDAIAAAPGGETLDKARFLDKARGEGVAVSRGAYFPNYFQALEFIHTHDLPLLFTTDAMLQTVFLSYDNILIRLEDSLLAPSLDSILGASARYAEQAYGQGEQGQDLHELLVTALFLLRPDRRDVETDNKVAAHVADIRAAAGMKTVSLWGRDTLIDFSQFKPRGHYTRSESLTGYFRAMMWLSRADLAFDLRHGSTSHAAAYTRMKKDAVALWDCMLASGSYPAWLEFDHYIEYLVGTSDGLNAKGMGRVAQALGARDVPALLAAFPEARFDSIVAATGLGSQAILSQQKSYGAGGGDPDLSPIFSFMPQRFILDSYTFSQLVFPLTREVFPAATQIAFALGDNSAAQDLPVPGSNAAYANLGAQRALYDGISEEGWGTNLYTSWLGFLRKLNGAEGNANVAPVFRSPAWRLKMRNTQLASWAQLRHNTILYAKQSYTGMLGCDFPKAYVEPYPDFFAGVAAYARMGAGLFRGRNADVTEYFVNLESISLRLRDVAARSAQGLAPTASQSDWLRSALNAEVRSAGCTSIKIFDGWYMDLIYGQGHAAENQMDYTIADVHTKPATDELGPMGVYSVACGGIRLAAVAIKTDSCATLFVGPIGSFHEVLKLNSLERMNDDEWTKSLTTGVARPAQPAWFQRIMSP